MSSRRQRRQIVRSEKFISDFEMLVTFAREAGEESRRTRGDDLAHRETERPDWRTADFLTDELRQILEDEVVPAYPEDEEFVRSEFHREVVKKALIGLRAETLRSVAERRGLDKRGSSEDIAERIARAYGYDDNEIAKLILDNVEEPDAESGHQTRLFPLRSDVNINGADARLREVEGRLVRTGVARWLAVDAVSRDDDEIAIDGRLRTYKAFVDEMGEEPTLGSSPDDKDVTIRLEDGKALMYCDDAGVTVSRVAARGVSAVIVDPFTAGLPIRRPLSGRLATMDDRTVLLLDLVYSRLARIGVDDLNLTVARFVTEKADQLAASAPDEAQEHSLKAVRFEGNHLLDSPQACALIARQHRGLVDISLWVAAPSLALEGDEKPWFPIRLTVERDHVGVLTGFGRHRPERSGLLHRMIVDQVEAALDDGPINEDELEQLAKTINDVAVSGEPGSGTLRRS